MLGRENDAARAARTIQTVLRITLPARYGKGEEFACEQEPLKYRINKGCNVAKSSGEQEQKRGEQENEQKWC